MCSSKSLNSDGHFDGQIGYRNRHYSQCTVTLTGRLMVCVKRPLPVWKLMAELLLKYIYNWVSALQQQQCIQVGCVLPTHYRSVGGGLPNRDPPGRQPLGTELPPPRQRPPWTEEPPVNRITDRCKNITLPQLRCGRQICKLKPSTESHSIFHPFGNLIK